MLIVLDTSRSNLTTICFTAILVLSCLADSATNAQTASPVVDGQSADEKSPDQKPKNKSKENDCDCLQPPPVSAKAGCTNQTEQFSLMGPPGQRMLSIARIFIPHEKQKAVLQGPRSAWNNEFPDQELEGRVGLNWLIEDHPYTIYAVTVFCKYQDSGKYFGNEPVPPDQRKWEQALSQALWQLWFDKSCVPAHGQFQLGTLKSCGYWVSDSQPIKAHNFMYFGPAADVVQQVRGGAYYVFTVIEKGDLIARLTFRKGSEPRIKQCCSTLENSIAKSTLEDMKRILNSAEFAIPNSFPKPEITLVVRFRSNSDNCPVEYSPTTKGKISPPNTQQKVTGPNAPPTIKISGGISGIEFDSPERTQRHVSQFMSLVQQTRQLINEDKMTGDRARKQIRALRDEEMKTLVNTTKPVGGFTTRLAPCEPVYTAMCETLRQLYPFVRNNSDALIPDPFFIPGLYGQHEMLKEQCELERWLIEQAATNSTQRKSLLNVLCMLLWDYLNASKKTGDKNFYNDSCKFVYDYINNWKPDEKAGIPELGSDFQVLVKRCQESKQ